MTSPMHARKAKLKTHLISAKAKLKHNVTPRRVVLLVAAATSAFLLVFTLRTLHSAALRGARAGAAGATAAPAAASTPPAAVADAHHADDQQEQQHHHQQQQECASKVPASVAEALVHYATSNETPRQTEAEAGAASRVLARRAPCGLLVFGLGPDSALWAALNHGGRTLFLEADADRIASARAAHPAGIDLQAHTVAFQQEAMTMTTPSDGDLLLVALRNSSDCAAAASPAKPLAPDHLEQSPCARAAGSVLRGGVGRDRGERAGAGRDIHRRGGGEGAAPGDGGDGRSGPRRGWHGRGEPRQGVPVRGVPQGGSWQAPALLHSEPQGQGRHAILPLR